MSDFTAAILTFVLLSGSIIFLIVLISLVEQSKPGRNDGSHGCWTVVASLSGRRTDLVVRLPRPREL